MATMTDNATRTARLVALMKKGDDACGSAAATVATAFLS